MKIARVFPTKTSMCPIDKDSYFGSPNLFTPQYDEVHISVIFTWDIKKALYLRRCWKLKAKDVLVGGPAFNGESKKPMVSGMYLKKGITITSRGCPNNCSFCLVKNNLVELSTFPEGNIVQDNNFLACSKNHRENVYKMLRKQKGIEFKGGLDKFFLTKEKAEELRSLRIRSLWLACDQPNSIKFLAKAVKILKRVGFKKNHLYCFCLIGKDMEEEENRLKEIFNIGCMPFAQLYRDKNNSIQYSKEWKHFAKLWSRPAIIRARMKGELCKKKILP